LEQVNDAPEKAKYNGKCPQTSIAWLANKIAWSVNHFLSSRWSFTGRLYVRIDAASDSPCPARMALRALTLPSHFDMYGELEISDRRRVNKNLSASHATGIAWS